MSYFKIPKDWTEKDCQISINKLLTEGQKRFDKEDYEKASYAYLKAAQIIRSIPELKRKLLKKEKMNREEIRELKKLGILKDEDLKEFLEKVA